MEPLDKSCFAYQGCRKYPIHTKEAASTSYRTFAGEKAMYGKELRDEIQANFDKAAAFHGLDLNSLIEKKAAAPREELVLGVSDENAVVMNKIQTPQDVDTAVGFILEKRASTPRKSLQEGARYILWNVSNSDLDMDTADMRKIAQIAGIGVGDRDDILYQLDKRATLLELPRQEQEMFWKFSRDLHAMDDDTFYKSATLTKICDMMDEIDQLYGLNHYYGMTKGGSVLKSPEETCFGQSFEHLAEQCQDMLYVPSIDTILSKTALEERKNQVKSFFQTYFGEKEPFGDVSMGTKVASLDKTTAEALIEALEG